jgi:hypothetical protein
MKNQMSEKRTIEGSSRTLLLFFCLFCYLAGADRDGWTPETAIDFVTFAKSNAKALLTAGVYQKFPCALPGAKKSKGALIHHAAGHSVFVLIREAAGGAK